MSDPPESREPAILVVDDDPVTRKLVLAQLEQLGGCRLLEAQDGEAAKAWLGRCSIDVAITDVMMPGLDGLDLMRWANETCPGPVWIILSGLDTFAAAVEAIHLGAFDFLTKPPESQRILVSARNALRHRRLLLEREALQRSLRAANEDLRRRLRQLENVCRVLRAQELLGPLADPGRRWIHELAESLRFELQDN